MQGVRLGLGTILWLLGALYVSVAPWLFPPRPLPPAPGEWSYVIRHEHYVFSLAAASLFFAALYFFLETALRLPLRRWLKLIHFGAMFLGVNLILLPTQILRLGGLPKGGSDPIPFFELCNAISSAGYLITLAGLGVFVLLLIDATWRQIRPSHLTPVAP